MIIFLPFLNRCSAKKSSVGMAKRNRPSQKLDWVAPLVADPTDATSPLGYSNPFKFLTLQHQYRDLKITLYVVCPCSTEYGVQKWVLYLIRCDKDVWLNYLITYDCVCRAAPGKASESAKHGLLLWSRKTKFQWQLGARDGRIFLSATSCFRMAA